MLNPYEIFGLSPNASIHEVKKIYRLYVSKMHPDKHNGDPFFCELLKKINDAYSSIKNGSSKAQECTADKKESYSRDADYRIRELERELQHVRTTNAQLSYEATQLKEAVNLLNNVRELSKNMIMKQSENIESYKKASEQYQTYFKSAVSLCITLIVLIIFIKAK